MSDPIGYNGSYVDEDAFLRSCLPRTAEFNECDQQKIAERRAKERWQDKLKALRLDAPAALATTAIQADIDLALNAVEDRWVADSKPTNPKDAIGSDKIPMHLWPGTASAGGALALLDGMLKYGRSNWREAGVRYTIYFDAAIRHLLAAMEGEDTDPDSGLPHEFHVLASVAIIVDARAAGQLTDDRQYPGGYRKLLDTLTPHVARLKARYAERKPKHWTIVDGLKR